MFSVALHNALPQILKYVFIVNASLAVSPLLQWPGTQGSPSPALYSPSPAPVAGCQVPDSSSFPLSLLPKSCYIFPNSCFRVYFILETQPTLVLVPGPWSLVPRPHSMGLPLLQPPFLVETKYFLGGLNYLEVKETNLDIVDP